MIPKRRDGRRYPLRSLNSSGMNLYSDIVCTVDKPYHPNGFVTQLRQIYYKPVGNVDLNAGTSEQNWTKKESVGRKKPLI